MCSADIELCGAIASDIDARLSGSGVPIETGAEKSVQLSLDRHGWLDLAKRVARHLAGTGGTTYFDRHDLLLVQRWQLAALKQLCTSPADVDRRQARLRHYTRFGCALADLLRARGLSVEIRVTAAPPVAL